MTNTKARTASLNDPETCYFIEAAAILLDMSSDIENLPDFKAMALQTENYDLADALDVLGTLYLDALGQVSDGDHSSLCNAMDALQHQTSVVLYHLDAQDDRYVG